MAHVILDQTQETTTTSGTGPYVLAGAVSSLKTFAAGMADGDTTDICIYDGTVGARLIAEATYSAKNNSLTIGTIYSSTASGNAAVNFAGNAGTTISAVIAAETINGLITASAAAQTTVISGVSSISESAGTITFVDSATGNTYLLPAQPQQSLTGLIISTNLFLDTQAAGYVVGTLSVQGTGISGLTPTYSIATDPTNGGFAISGKTLTLAAAVAAGNYTLQIGVAVGNLTQTFPLAIESVSGSKITNITISNNTLSSGAVGTIVGKLGVTGIGSPTASAFTLSGTNASDFTVDTSNNLVIGSTALAVGSYSMNVTAIPTSPNLPTPTNVSGQILDITGSGSDLFVLEITQAFYQTGAQFTVSVTPQGGSASQLGGVFTATALAGSATPDLFVFRGAFGPNPFFSINQVNFNNNGTASAPSELRTINIISAVYNDVQATSITTPFYPTQASQFPISCSFPDPTFTQLETITIQAAEKITGIVLSSTTFQAGQPAGEVVGTLSLQGTGLTGTPVYSIDNTKYPNFTIANGNQVVTAVANLTAGGSYGPGITVTLAGVSNSPYTQQIPLTCYAPAGTTQSIAGINLLDINQNPLTTVEAGTAQYTRMAIVQAEGSTGPLADPISYALTSQSGPTANAFTLANYNELSVGTASLAAGTYTLTIQATAAAGANSPQSKVFTITVAPAGTITLNSVASSVVQVDEMVLSGTYTGPDPQFIGYAFNGHATHVPAYNLTINNTVSPATWTASITAPSVVSSSNTITVSKGYTGVISAASNTFATTAFDGTLRLYFTPIWKSYGQSGAPFGDYAGSMSLGQATATGGAGPYGFSVTTISGNSYTISYDGRGTLAINSGSVSTFVDDVIKITVTDASGNTASKQYTIKGVPWSTLSLANYNIFPGTQPLNAAATQYFTVNNKNPLGGSSLSSWGQFNVTVTNYSEITPLSSAFGSSTQNYFFWPGSCASGDYPIAIAYNVGGTTITGTFMLSVFNEAPSFIAWTPNGTVTTATPPGLEAYPVLPDYYLGQITSTSRSNTSSVSFQSVSNQNITVTGYNGRVLASDYLPLGNIAITALVKNAQNLSTSFNLTIPVSQGNMLPASDMTAVVATNLINTIGSFPWYATLSNGPAAITPTLPAGITGTPKWSLLQPNTDMMFGFVESQNGNPYLRFKIDENTGIVRQQTIAAAQTYSMTLRVTDGINTCQQTFNLIVNAVQGPTVHVGQGMSTQYPSDGYEYFSTMAASRYGTGPYNHTCRFSGGETVLIYPNSDINYYAGDDGDALNPTSPKYVNNWTQGFSGPVTFSGVAGGAMPRVGGTWQSADRNGMDAGGKGFYVWNGGDWLCENLEISDCHNIAFGNGTASDATNQPYNIQACAVWLNGALANGAGPDGTVNFSNLHVHHCDQGLHSGDSNQTINVNNIYLHSCGGSFLSSGDLHGIYFTSCWSTNFDTVLLHNQMGSFNAKSRAQSGTFTNSRSFDGERGQSLKVWAMVNGGKWLMSGNVFQSGSQPQGFATVCIGEDRQGADWPVNIVTSENNTYITDNPDVVSYGLCAYVWQSQRTGLYESFSSTNDSFWGYYLASEYVNDSDFFQARNNAPGYPANSHTWTASGITALATRPKLDFTSPCTPPVTVRDGPSFFPYDGDYKQTWGEVGGGQMSQYGSPPQYSTTSGDIDIGSDDFWVTAANAPVGTVLFTPTGNGAIFYKGNPTQPDERIDPFGAGSTWSLVYNWAPLSGSSFPCAPVGQFTINSTTGAVSVGQPLTAGKQYWIFLRVDSADKLYWICQRCHITVY